jgi:hypothetical protein
MQARCHQKQPNSGRSPFSEPPVLGSTRPCRICGQLVTFRLAQTGKYMPLDPDGGWHWLYCYGQLSLELAS